MKKHISIIIYSLVILLMFLASIFPEIISNYSPYSINIEGISPPGNKHLLGTDFLGRDIFSRTLIGGRVSILIGVISRIGSIFIGLLVGIFAGIARQGIRMTINGIIEVFLSIPSLLLALALAMVLGEGYQTIVIAITAGTWAPVARFISTKIVEIKNEDFVISARSIGAGNVRIAFLYILPSLFPLLIPLASTGIATSIMMESTLSFLGLSGGTSIDSLPSWGIMIQEGSRFIFDAPWIIISPSISLTILILCFNQIGDKIVSFKRFGGSGI